MKNLTNRLVSFMLVLALALSLSAPAFAAEYSGTNDLENEIGTTDDIQAAREAYYALSPEAKEIFDATLADTPELLDFHQTYVDENFVAPEQARPQAAAAVYAVAADPMTVLMAELSALALPNAVLYSLKAMGAGMIAAIADGPLPIGDILLAAATASVVAVVALNWDTVAPKWNSIVRAFQKAFADTASNIMNAFTQIKSDAKKEAEAQAKKKESEQRIKDVLKGKTKDRKTSGNTNIYEGEGGLEAAQKDFNKLNEGGTVKRGETTVGQLPDGTKINVRSESSDSRVTLEIQGKGQFKIKIRYND